MTKDPVQPQDKYVVRFPEGMREDLKTRAKANKRSLNAEIVGLLTIGPIAEFVIKDSTAKLEKLEAENAKLTVAMENAVSLPKGLRDRIEKTAVAHGRTITEEAVQVLEEAFPPPRAFSLDEFNEDWVARILIAPEQDRPMLIDQANAVLVEQATDFRVWLGDGSNGDAKGSVIFGRRLEAEPGAYKMQGGNATFTIKRK